MKKVNNKFSIIIVVKNDQKLKDTLDILINIIDPLETEIIVVDASEGKLDKIKNNYNQYIRWIYYYNRNNKKISISEQRNLGIQNSKGDIIIFLDSSCIPVDNWLYEITNPIINNNEYVVTGYVKSSQKSIHDRTWEKRLNKKYLTETGAANLALKREVIDNVGYFDENFEAGEDIDFSWRIIDNGYKIFYARHAIIYHDWGDIESDKKRAVKYGEARIKLYRKHPNKTINLLKYDNDLYSIYCIFFFLYIIFLLPLIIINKYLILFILLPIFLNNKKNVINKLLFDFYWGFGFMKGLFTK